MVFNKIVEKHILPAIKVSWKFSDLTQIGDRNKTR